SADAPPGSTAPRQLTYGQLLRVRRLHVSSHMGPYTHYPPTLPGQIVRTQAFQAAQWALWTGLASPGLLLASLALILRRQVGRPLQELLGGIRSAAAGEVRAVRAAARDELGHLALAFNTMVGQVAERDAALRVEKERFRALIEHAADVILV